MTAWLGGIRKLEVSLSPRSLIPAQRTTCSFLVSLKIALKINITGMHPHSSFKGENRKTVLPKLHTLRRRGGYRDSKTARILGFRVWVWRATVFLQTQALPQIQARVENTIIQALPPIRALPQIQVLPSAKHGGFAEILWMRRTMGLIV